MCAVCGVRCAVCVVCGVCILYVYIYIRVIQRMLDEYVVTFEPFMYISLVLSGFFIILNIFFICIPIPSSIKHVNVKIALIGMFVFASLFVFIYYFIYMLLIGGKNYQGAIYYILGIASVPTVFTIFFLFITSERQEVVSIFENTIGYVLCSTFYKKSINEIFEIKKDIFKDEKYKKHYDENKSVLLTLFRYVRNFEKYYEDFNEGNAEKNDMYNFYIKSGNGVSGKTNFSELEGLVNTKNTIGICSWFYISSLFASVISVKILSRI